MESLGQNIGPFLKLLRWITQFLPRKNVLPWRSYQHHTQESVFRCTAWWLDNHVLSKWFLPPTPLPNISSTHGSKYPFSLYLLWHEVQFFKICQFHRKRYKYSKMSFLVCLILFLFNNTFIYFSFPLNFFCESCIRVLCPWDVHLGNVKESFMN